MNVEKSTIQIGTRGSLLATTQTELVVSELRVLHPNIDFQIVIIETTGDRRANVPYSEVGTKGMFVKEIEEALIDNTIDVAVHSLKDMPGDLPPGLEIPCVPRREDPFDAFVSNKFGSLDELPTGARVGTSSARRRAQISAYRDDLTIIELRGNLDTRLRKLAEDQYDAIIVACAGMHRLGKSHLITERISEHICLPAVGQGALALETRLNDERVKAVLLGVHDSDAGDCVTAERALLAALGGGCSVPVAAHAELSADTICLSALVAAPDGSTIIRSSVSGPRSQAKSIGIEAVNKLFAQNAEFLLSTPHVTPVQDAKG